MSDAATVTQPAGPLQGLRIGATRLDKRGEDRLLLEPEAGLFGVFDGAGGHQNAAAAAQAAAAAVGAHVLTRSPSCRSVEDAVAVLTGALHVADDAVAAAAVGGATTATVALLPPWAWRAQLPELPAIVAAVGDSRVGLLRDHRFEFITLDHGFGWGAAPAEAKARQDRLDAATDPRQLADELDRAAFAQRHLLTHALTGSADLDVRRYMVRMSAGDRMLIESDGLHDNLTAVEITTLLDTASTAQAAADALARAALYRSREPRERWPRAKTDDISAIVIEMTRPAPSRPDDEIRWLAPGESVELNLHSSELHLSAGDLHLVLTRRSGRWWAVEETAPAAGGASPLPGPGCWALSEDEPVTFGRQSYGLWEPPSPLVSRRHVAVTVRASDTLLVADLGSRNGVSLAVRPE